jgi:SHS2 domain-containing protein
VGHRFVEHVGEVEVELEAPSEAGVFESALAAFAELAGGGEGEAAQHEVELTSSDRALLLVEWLSELVYLAETERFVPERVTAFELDDGRLRATVTGYRGHPSHLVKAVTLHGLALERKGEAWHARVVLDV